MNLRIANPKLSLEKLAKQFLAEHPLKSIEGQCAATAKAFGKFLKAKEIKFNIIDARNYKGALKTVGDSNHVLAVVSGYYVDFTAKQFDASASSLIIDKVSNLKREWGVVNTYSSYQDFTENFSKKQI